MKNKEIKSLLRAEADSVRLPDISGNIREKAAKSEVLKSEVLKSETVAIETAIEIVATETVAMATVAEKTVGVQAARGAAGRKRILSLAVAVAAVFVLVFAAVFIPQILQSDPDGFDSQEYAAVTVDINSGLEISVNAEERIIGIRTVDASAAALLDGISYDEELLYDVLAEIIAKCKNGSLSEENPEQNIILVSVSCVNIDDGNRIKENIDGAIHKCCEQNGMAVKVNLIDYPQELASAAAYCNVTPAKLQLILTAYSVDAGGKSEADFIGEFRHLAVGEIYAYIAANTRNVK
ncbi:MAG: hypothetical protein LBT55_06040 [Clostridiaceae bacterium]|jgi:hypothetical protein|nr:hypothetical protein [Clostridiaceae bacterium]